MNSAMFSGRGITLVSSIVTMIAFVGPALGQIINEDLKLLANDGVANDIFGRSVAIDQGVIAVGASGANDHGFNSGAVYLLNMSTGAQIIRFAPSDGELGDRFGNSIAFDDGIVAVGAFVDDDNGPNSGSVYLFDAATGTQIAKLLPLDGAADDKFGFSIDIDDGIVAVGVFRDDDNGIWSGSAYLFDASTGVQIAKLLPDDGEENDLFGRSIAIDNGIVVVGAKWDDDNGPESGSVYLFDATTGAQLAKLKPNDGAAVDVFGSSVAISNGVIAVGAPGDDDNGSSSGSAYTFNASTGAQIAKFSPSDGAADEHFGIPVSLSKGIVAVGSEFDNDNGTFSGSAYIFNAFSGAQFAKLLASDGASHDFFGRPIAIDDGIVSVGAAAHDDNGSDSGAVYLYDASSFVPCPADLNGDGIVDVLDLLQVVHALRTQGGAVEDLNGDGVVTPRDMHIVIRNFGSCDGTKPARNKPLRIRNQERNLTGRLGNR